MNDDEPFMQKAIAKAREGVAAGQSPFGACIVRYGQVIWCEHNLVWRTPDATAHAEVTAIRIACKALSSVKLNGATIYSTTEPCPMCFSAIHWAGISRIVHGSSILDAQRAGFSELGISNVEMNRLGGSGIEIVPALLASEAVKLFAYSTDAKRYSALGRSNFAAHFDPNGRVVIRHTAGRVAGTRWNQPVGFRPMCL